MNSVNRGLSYEQASRKGHVLVQDAASGRRGWCAIVDELVDLREIMRVTAHTGRAAGHG